MRSAILPVIVLIELVNILPLSDRILDVMRDPVATTPLIAVVRVLPDADMRLVLMIFPVPIDPPILDVITLPVLVREFGTERVVTVSAPEIVTFPF